MSSNQFSPPDTQQQVDAKAEQAPVTSEQKLTEELLALANAQPQSIEEPRIKVALTNAEKQKRYRDRQKAAGKKELRGYLSPEALTCYEQIQEQTQWSDSVILSNAIRLTYAAYKNGQVGLLNRWLTSKKL